MYWHTLGGLPYAAYLFLILSVNGDLKIIFINNAVYYVYSGSLQNLCNWSPFVVPWTGPCNTDGWGTNEPYNWSSVHNWNSVDNRECNGGNLGLYTVPLATSNEQNCPRPDLREFQKKLGKRWKAYGGHICGEEQLTSVLVNVGYMGLKGVQYELDEIAKTLTEKRERAGTFKNGSEGTHARERRRVKVALAGASAVIVLTPLLKEGFCHYFSFFGFCGRSSALQQLWNKAEFLDEAVQTVMLESGERIHLLGHSLNKTQHQNFRMIRDVLQHLVNETGRQSRSWSRRCKTYKAMPETYRERTGVYQPPGKPHRSHDSPTQWKDSLQGRSSQLRLCARRCPQFSGHWKHPSNTYTTGSTPKHFGRSSSGQDAGSNSQIRTNDITWFWAGGVNDDHKKWLECADRHTSALHKWPASRVPRYGSPSTYRRQWSNSVSIQLRQKSFTCFWATG